MLFVNGGNHDREENWSVPENNIMLMIDFNNLTELEPVSESIILQTITVFCVFVGLR